MKRNNFKKLVKYAKKNDLFKSYVLRLNEIVDKFVENPGDEEIFRDFRVYTAIMRTAFDIFGVELSMLNDLVKELRMEGKK